YFLVHDIFIHQRFKLLRNTDNSYFRAIRRAHKVHHKHIGKEDGECFGMLWVPMKYFRDASPRSTTYVSYYHSPMKYLYLLVNFFTLIIPFIDSFQPKINFHHTWSGFFPAAILVGLVFIGWDMWFTSLAVWGVNPSYLSGIYVGNLPLEEVLFFVCIPYACLFTYFCLSKFFDLAWNRKAEAIFCAAFSAVLIAVGCLNLEKIYTSLTFISTGVVSLTLRFLL